uniref:YqiA/YcfP family alpha/beta fold hydrolase n=1 Tax=Klebsiella pneumoniae TaxID=573 RepID=UPI003B984485
MKKLLYIHGFRSSAKSSTILNLKANYHEVEVHAFDVTHHPAESIKKIEDYVREHGIEILAGSSLGGYY